MLVKSGLAAMVIIAAIKYALIPLLFSVFPNI